MPVYPTYFPQMNNGYNQQMQNPYQQRMDFLQSYQQSLQQPIQQIPQVNQQMNVLGKIVDGIEAVKAIDIPMDGAMYYFPKADGTEVYGKRWVINEGRTVILPFRPILETEPSDLSGVNKKTENELFKEFTEMFGKRFDNLEKQINDLITKPMTKSITSMTKKEGIENE